MLKRKSLKFICSVIVIFMLIGMGVSINPVGNGHLVQLGQMVHASSSMYVQNVDVDGDGTAETPYQYIKFTSNDTWTVPVGTKKIDVFLVGGGGGGGSAGSGGGGGYTLTAKGVIVNPGQIIPVKVGTGGTGGTGAGATQYGFGADGTFSQFIEFIADGGKGGKFNGGSGGDGGSGGGTASNTEGNTGAPGGSDGSNGGICAPRVSDGFQMQPGKGQGRTTREFGEPAGKLYAGGGGGGPWNVNPGTVSGGTGGGGAGNYSNGYPGEVNTGGGGGGCSFGTGGQGGSGIVIVRYKENANLTINITKPSQNETLSEANTNYIPSISVSDTDNNLLTCKYFIDSETAPRDTKTITNTTTTQVVNFAGFNVNTLAEGNHTIKFEVSDGLQLTTRTVNFTYDKKPIIGTVSASSTTKSITVTGSAIDTGSGLMSNPYKITIGSKDSAWLQAPGNGQVDSTVVTSAYDTSGNSGRKLVRLSNGWLVCAVFDSTSNPNNYYRLYLSKNSGKDWNQLCYIYGNALWQNSIALSTHNNFIYALVGYYNNTNDYKVYLYKIDPSTQQNVNIVNTNYCAQIDSAQSAIGQVSLECTNIGTFYATWVSKNSSYPNSFNIRYSKSTDGVYWDTPTQITTFNNANYNFSNPCIIVRNSTPVIVTQYTTTSTSYGILCTFFNGTAWSNQNQMVSIHNVNSYSQSNPSAVVSPNGDIHVVWDGKDPTSPDRTDIYYSKSSDGGQTWSPRYAITNEAWDQCYPSIAANKDNTLWVYWGGVVGSGNLQLRSRKLINGTWESIENKTNIANSSYYAGNPALLSNYQNFTEPLIIWKDTQVNAIRFMGEMPSEITYTLPNEQNTELLKPNTQYPIKFEAQDKAGNIATYTQDVYTKAEVSTLSAITLSPTSATLTVTDNNPGYTQYQITSGTKYISQSGTLTNTPAWIKLENKTTTTKAITVTGLSPATEYKFQIKARNGEGVETALSNIAACTTSGTPLPIPAGIKASATTNKITVTWNAVDGADGYEIEIGNNTTASSINLYFEHKDLQPDTQHTYRVRAKKGASASDWSTVITKKTLLVPPSAPQNIITTSSGISIAISWGTVSNATGYDIEADGQVIAVGSKDTYLHTGLKPLTQHTYRVRARNIAGIGPWSNLMVCYTTDGIPTAAPANVRYSQSNTTITLTWDPVEDAEYYEVLDITNTTTGNAINNGLLTTCEIKGLIPEKDYKFKVRARSSMDDGDTPWSAEIPITTFLLDIPVNITALESDKSIKFKWDSIKNADSYVIQLIERTDTGQLVTRSAINVPGATEYLIEDDIKPETEYLFSIMAKSTTTPGISGWTDQMSVTTLPTKPGTPQNVSAMVTDTKITARWDTVESAEGYDIEIDGIFLENDGSTTYTYNELEPYTVYKYRVRARNAGVEGDWSETQEIRTMPGRPKSPEGITVKSTQTGATLTWTPEKGATGYDIQICQLQDDGKVKVIKTIEKVTRSSYTHRKLTPGAEYRYSIKTRNVEGESPWSGYIINNAIKADCTKNEAVDMGLTATDVVDFNSYSMVVTYNPSVIDVTDLCALSGKPELTTGKIDGTDITIKEYTPGKIVFVVDKALTPGEAWTGVINSIKFKAKVTGGTTITYTVYTKPEEVTP